MSQAYARPCPHAVVPIHFAFRGGPPRQVLDAFARAVARRAPGTEVRVLPPGMPLTAGTAVGAAARA